jgi:hypothetical protein
MFLAVVVATALATQVDSTWAGLICCGVVVYGLIEDRSRRK